MCAASGHVGEWYINLVNLGSDYRTGSVTLGGRAQPQRLPHHTTQKGGKGAKINLPHLVEEYSRSASHHSQSRKSIAAKL